MALDRRSEEEELGRWRERTGERRGLGHQDQLTGTSNTITHKNDSSVISSVSVTVFKRKTVECVLACSVNHDEARLERHI